jgi:hypothetical protein
MTAVTAGGKGAVGLVGWAYPFGRVGGIGGRLALRLRLDPMESAPAEVLSMRSDGAVEILRPMPSANSTGVSAS